MREKRDLFIDSVHAGTLVALAAVMVFAALRCASPAVRDRAETNRACASMNRDVTSMIVWTDDDLAEPEGVVELLKFSRDQAACIKAQNADLISTHRRLVCSRRQLDEIRRSPVPGSVFNFTERCK